MVAQYHAGWVFGIGAEFGVGGDFEVVETVEDGPGCQDVVEASDGFGAHEGLALSLMRPVFWKQSVRPAFFQVCA